MSSSTDNLKLIKPDVEDRITQTIADLATNFEKIDLEFKKTNDSVSQHTSEIESEISDIHNNISQIQSDLSDIQTNTNKINSKINDFDFTTVSPSYYETLWGMPSNTIMQCFVFCEETNEIYVSQLDGAQTGVETYLLARFT